MANIFSKKLERYLPEDATQRTDLSRRLDKLKTVPDLLTAMVDAVKGTDLSKALAGASPWLEATGGALAESVAPIKFVVKLFEGLGRINDGPTLGYVACSLAYQRAFAVSLPRVPELAAFEARSVKKLDVESAESYDFGSFTFEKALQHAFIRDADEALRRFLVYSLDIDDEVVVRKLVGEVHNRFVLELRLLLTNRSTQATFKPFHQLIQLVPSDTDAYVALEQHADHQRWLYEQRPVLDSEPFALRHIYVDLDCGDLSWGEIDDPDTRHQTPGQNRRTPLDPFLEHNGGRRPLLDTVLNWIADPDYADALVIQGTAGSGKSSFTVRLCAELEALALRPVRIELKNLATRSGKDLMQALSEAVELNDPRRDPQAHPRFGPDLFLGTRIFDDGVELTSGAHISRYVLILDGWDEISAAASIGYQKELERVLRGVRDEFLRNRKVKVRVILAGRPTRAVADSDFFQASTRVLTVRPMNPDQLETLVGHFREAVVSQPVEVEHGEPWSLEGAGEVLGKLSGLYSEEWKGVEEAIANEQTPPPQSFEVLGQPLLTHLILRLVAREPEGAEKLVENTTALYRSMVDLVIENAGKATGANHGRDGQAVVTGNDLRSLLQDTAAAMKALDVRDLPPAELKIRLKTTFKQLRAQVQQLGEESVLSRLLISFFFKGGHPEHGCAFSHKSFREYLFAEKVVERLKEYGREAPDELPFRAESPEDYWHDFPVQDPRRELSRDLADLLGPQWLNREELDHLMALIAWEFDRSFGKDPFPRVGLQTKMLEIEEWQRIRDGLADLWDWWGEGVHLRSQPRLDDRSGQIEYSEPYAVEVAKFSRWLSVLDEVQVPVRSVTIDAQLGDGLFVLTARVHAELASRTEEGPSKTTKCRPYQASRQQDSGVRLFAPTGPKRNFFLNYIARVNAGGFRPLGLFPKTTFAEWIDLSNANLSDANLSDANLSDANLFDANLYNANLYNANLYNAYLYNANLYNANLSDADLFDANLSNANLYNANLYNANLYNANLYNANLYNANLYNANLSGANLFDANLSNANLSNANLFDANLSGANLSGANLEEASISMKALRSTHGRPKTLPDGTQPKDDKEYHAWLKAQDDEDA